MPTPLQTQLAQARVQAIVDSPDIQHYREMAARIQYGKSFDQLDAAARRNISYAAGMLNSAMSVHTAGSSMAGAAGFDALYSAIRQPGAAMQVSGARGSYGTSYSQGQLGMNAATSMVRMINASRASHGAGGSLFNVVSSRADANTEAQLAAAYLKAKSPSGAKLSAVEFGTTAEAFNKGLDEAAKKFGADYRKGGSHESLGRMGAARGNIDLAARAELKNLIANGNLSDEAKDEIANGLDAGQDAFELLQKYDAHAIKNLKKRILGPGGRVKGDYKNGVLGVGEDVVDYELSGEDYNGVFTALRNGGMTDFELGKDVSDEMKNFIKKASPMIKELQDAFNTKDFNELQENMRQLNMKTLNSEQAVKQAKNWMSRTKEYAEMMGISFEEAVQQQKAIAAGMPNMTGNVLVDIQRNTANLVRSNQNGPYSEEQTAQIVAQNTQTDVEESTPALLAMDLLSDKTHRGAGAEEVANIQGLLEKYKSATNPADRKRIGYELEMATRDYYRTQEAIDAAQKNALSTEEGRQLVTQKDKDAIKFNAAEAARNAGVSEDMFVGLAEVMGGHMEESAEAVRLAASDSKLEDISDPTMREAVKRLRDSGAVRQGDEQSGNDFYGKYKAFFLESQEGKLAMGAGGSMLDEAQSTALRAEGARNRINGNAFDNKRKELGDQGVWQNFSHALFNGTELTADEALGLITATGSGNARDKDGNIIRKYDAAKMAEKFGIKEGKDYQVLDTSLEADQSTYTKEARESIAAFLGISADELGTDRQEIEARMADALDGKAVSKLADGRTMVAEADTVKKAGEYYRQNYLKSKDKNKWFLGTETSKGNISDALASTLMYDEESGEALGFAIKNANGGEDHLEFNKDGRNMLEEKKSLFKALGYSDDDLKENGALDTLWKKMSNGEALEDKDKAVLKDFEKRATAGADEKKAQENQENLISGMSAAIKGAFAPLLGACSEQGHIRTWTMGSR